MPRSNRPKAPWLGANGKFTALMKQLGTLPKAEKPAAGKLINTTKIALEAALAERRAELELEAALPKEPTDFTLPGRRRALGKLHPLTQVTEDIVRAFRKLGFTVPHGPEIEDEYHCFDALNTPADHPARGRRPIAYTFNRPPGAKIVLCLHPTGHHSVLAAPPNKKEKPILLFTNRPK